MLIFCLQAKCVGGTFFFLREEIFITREGISPNRRVLPGLPWDKGVRSLCAVDVMEDLGLNHQLPSQNNPTSQREKKGLCVAWQARRRRGRSNLVVPGLVRRVAGSLIALLCDQKIPSLRAVDHAKGCRPGHLLEQLCDSISCLAGGCVLEKNGLWCCISWRFKGKILCFLVCLFASHWGISYMLRWLDLIHTSLANTLIQRLEDHVSLWCRVIYYNICGRLMTLLWWSKRISCIFF